MSLIENEQTKLLASAFDRASTSCVTVGIFAPFAAVLYNFGGNGGNVSIATLAFGTFGWLVVTVGLHYMARRILRGLVP